MDWSLIPKSIYLRTMKADLKSESIEDHMERMKNELLEKWSKLMLNPELNPVFFYEEDYNSISATAFEIHDKNVFSINSTNTNSRFNLKSNESAYHIRIPMAFFELKLTASQPKKENNQVEIIDIEEERIILNEIGDGFNQRKNISQISRKLISRGVIINSIKRFCTNENIRSMQFRIDQKRTHFVDSTNGIVYKGIRNCLGSMFGINPETVQEIIEK
jgi:hypothetical protein